MSDNTYMNQAVAAARSALGRTSPNPAVGAMLVRAGRVIGVGSTQPAGGAHAEIVAIRAANLAHESTVGSTMYVTLEPCCHHGRTPPCTDALILAGVSRVVVGVLDPFEPMQGRGLSQLRAAGISVELGLRGEACERIIRGFKRAITRGLPEVSLKVGTSLDGKIATASGESQWITGPGARAVGHGLRATHDAILVGIGTVLADDPRLTCRTEEAPDPVPVVLDSHLRIPSDAALFNGTRRPLIFCGPMAPDRDLPADVERVPSVGRGLDIERVLQVLVRRNLYRILVEGGGAVLRSFLDGEWVDELNVFVAPMIIPGGHPWIGGAPISHLSEAPRWKSPVVSLIETDVHLQYQLTFCEKFREEGPCLLDS